VVALPTKEQRKTPPKKQEATPSVDLDRLAGLIDRSRKDEGRQTPVASDAAEKGARPRTGIGSGEELTVTEQDAIRAHVERYWRSPADMPDPARLVVRVRFEINADGSLAGQPEVVSPTGRLDPTQRAAVENALRAVRVAQPLPVDKKRTERAIFIMNFDPRQMAGMQ
jgi:colicin import membrane protein